MWCDICVANVDVVVNINKKKYLATLMTIKLMTSTLCSTLNK